MYVHTSTQGWHSLRAGKTPSTDNTHHTGHQGWTMEQAQLLPTGKGKAWSHLVQGFYKNFHVCICCVHHIALPEGQRQPPATGSFTVWVAELELFMRLGQVSFHPLSYFGSPAQSQGLLSALPCRENIKQMRKQTHGQTEWNTSSEGCGPGHCACSSLTSLRLLLLLHGSILPRILHFGYMYV